MTTLSITLPQKDAQKLTELAAREGATLEDVALAALRARFDADEVWRSEVLAGLAELDAGKGIAFEDFERDMERVSV